MSGTYGPDLLLACQIVQKRVDRMVSLSQAERTSGGSRAIAEQLGTDAAAIQMLVDHARLSLPLPEVVRPRCACPLEAVVRVVRDHGTCAMGGCPYGGDI